MAIKTYDPNNIEYIPFEDSLPEYKPQPPTQMEILKSAFARENVIGSYFNRLENQVEDESVFTGDREISDFDPFTYAESKGITDSTLIERITFANNEEEVDEIYSLIERQRRNLQVLEQGGVSAIAWSMAASILDPTILIPGTAGFRAATKAGQLAKASAASGALGVAAIGTQEVMLQSTQEERSIQESVINTIAGGLLGGLLGAGATFLKSSDRVIVEEVIKREVGNLDAANFRVTDKGKVLLDCDPT